MLAKAQDLARLVGGRLMGNGEISVEGFASLDAAGERDVSFAEGACHREQALHSRAAVLVTDAPLPGFAGVQILVADAALAFALIARHLSRAKEPPAGGIDARACIHEAACVDCSARIHAFVSVARGASIGARTELHPGVCIGEEAVIGEDCILHPNVSVLERVRVGNRVVLHPGVVLGTDGFGYATNPLGEHIKIPQVGTVVIEDDVEIGANSTVDRARFAETRIGAGTKIDNLVMVAHNVVLGAHCLLAAQVGIAGSSVLGERVVLGGHVGVKGHVKVGSGVQVGGYSAIGGDLPEGLACNGIPARPVHQNMKIFALEGKLPEIWRRLLDLEQRLEAQAADGSEPA